MAPVSDEELPRAAVGTHVILALLLGAEEEQLEFDIVSDEQADFTNGFLGAGTPLAKAIIGHLSGDAVPYRAEDVNGVRILAIGPAQSTPAEDVKARREATLRKAVEDSDRTNAIIFASSFSGKWGDYDPTAFLDEAEKQDLPRPPAEEDESET